VVFRVPEKRSDNFTERKEYDLEFIKDLIDIVFRIKLKESDIDRMYRLGRWSADAQADRPILVSFRDVELKQLVMANIRDLKQADGRFKGIGISQDLPPQEREEIKRMLAEAKSDHEATNPGDSVNYKFLVVGQGQRKKVIKVKRVESPVG